MKNLTFINETFKKTWNILKNSWKVFITGIVTCFIVTAIVFSLPLKTVAIETYTTYYEIVIKQEPYTELEPYIAYNSNANTRILINGFYKVIPNGVIMPFTIDKPNSRLFGHFDNTIPGRFAIMGIGDRVIWEMMGSRNIVDLVLQPGEYKAMFKEDVMWGEDCYIFLAMQWGDSEPVIKYSEVTKYREIPVQVEKQQIVTENARMSLWRYIFWKSPLLK